MAKAIKGAPKGKVTTPSIKRDGSRLKASWKTPSNLTSENNEHRFTGIDIEWVVDLSNKKAKKDPKRLSETGNEKRTSSSIGLGNFTANTGKKKIDYDREDFHPYKGKPTISGYTVMVRGTNGKDGKDKGPWAKKAYDLHKPHKPTVSTLAQDEETGHILFEITAAKDNGSYERHDTQYQIEVYDSRKKKNTTDVTDRFTGDSRKWTPAETGHHVDVQDRMLLGYNDYVRVRVRARSRGLAGNSGWTKWKDRTLYVSFPAEPQVNGGEKGVLVPDIRATGKVTVKVKTNTSTTHPVTGIRLEYLKDTTAKTAREATAQDGWQALDVVDDGQCTALSTTVAEISSQAGKTTWVRLKSWNQFEGIFYRYSEPVRVSAIDEVAPTADDIEVISAVPGDDGSTAVVTLGWNKDGKDDSTSTEISWSTDEHALRSTEGPKTHEFAWSDGRYPKSGTKKFNDSAEVHVKGLEEGETYYVWARRHLETDEVDDWGEYGGPKKVRPVSSPSNVVLTAPPFVARGSDIPLTWTFDSTATQTEWYLLMGPTTTTVDADGKEVLWVDPARANVARSGTDAAGATVIPADRIASPEYQALMVDGALAMAVRVGTGGATVDSPACRVRIADPPTISLDVPATLTVQPLKLSLASPTAPDVVAIVTASVGGGGDEGVLLDDQAGGDVIWSEALRPDWVEVDGAYAADLPLPTGRDFRDGRSYDVSVRATDPDTGLSSVAQTAAFDVKWEYQAPAPSGSIEVVPSDVTDADGIRTRQCEIRLATPEGAKDDDVYDVFRLTPDGPYPIARSVATDAVVTDRYAPYGGTEKGYRVMSRTQDGDWDWLDFGYELPGRELRIDFGNEYVELPWNVVPSESYGKDFEARAKLSGETDGYWNRAVSHAASFSTDLIRISEQDKAAAVRRLARHVGPCFVRTPDGLAFAADVQVSEMGGARRDAALAVRLSATEVSLTEEYMATKPSDGEVEEEP